MTTLATIRNTFSDLLWNPVRQYYSNNRTVRRVAVALLIGIALTKALMFIADSLEPVPTQKNLQALHRYTVEAQSRMQVIHTTSGIVIDSVAENESASFYSQYASQDAVALYLHHYASQWLALYGRSVSRMTIPDDSRLSIAIYSETAKLIGWSSDDISCPDFDTVFSLAPVLEHRSRLSGIDSTSRELYYITARKIFTHLGVGCGYVVLKYRFAERAEEVHTGRSWIITEPGYAAPSEASFRFIAAPHTLVAHEIYIDSTERSALAGYCLPISRPTLQLTGFARGLQDTDAMFELLFIGIYILVLRHCLKLPSNASGNFALVALGGIGLELVAVRILIYLSGAVAPFLSRIVWFQGDLSNIVMLDTSAECAITLMLFFLFLYCTYRFTFPRLEYQGTPTSIRTALECLTFALILVALCYFLYQTLIESLFVFAKTGHEQITTENFSLGIWLSLTFITVAAALVEFVIISILVRAVRSSILTPILQLVVIILFVCLESGLLFAITQSNGDTYIQPVLFVLLFIFSTLVAWLEYSSQFESIKKFIHPALGAISIFAIGGIWVTMLSIGLNNTSIRQHNKKYALLGSESSSLLQRYIQTTTDSTVHTATEYNTRAYDFWRSFFKNNPNVRLSFSISPPGTRNSFFQIGECLDGGSEIDTRTMNTQIDWAIIDRDSSGGNRIASILGSSSQVLQYSLSLLKAPSLEGVPDDRVSSILWQTPLVASPITERPFHELMRIVLACIAITFMCFALSFFLRLLDVQSFHYKISLQEKFLFIVFFAAGISYNAVVNITKYVLSSNTERASKDAFAANAQLTHSELNRYARFDSSAVLERHITSTAEALNCDIVVYDRNNIVTASSAPDALRLGLLPHTLPTMLVTGNNISASLAGTTVRLAYGEISSSNSEHYDIKYLLLKKVESYSLLLERMTADISDALGVLAVLALFAASYLSSRIVRPLDTLRRATEEVATGQLAITLPKRRGDEIGEVIDGFNKMTAELSLSRERVGQIEREGAWKEMARQVAHEIKNPLTPIKLSIQHVQHAFEHQDTNFPNIFRRVLKTINEQIDVLTRIATEFARFGEMPRRRYTFTSLRQVVESAVSLFEAERSHIRFAIEIPDKMSKIYADEEEFRRTLVNLIKNSIQAISGWGIILIAAEERNGLIYIRITDSGAGMKPETVGKAFDPNFSTKTSGMGLGLAIVKKTITDMSGAIGVDSEVGRGTTFFIELPARDPGSIQG